MISITLSSEQIHNAPAAVRRWIEREILTSMGQQPPAPENDSQTHTVHLAACSEQDATAILSQIQGVLPAVNVCFEFGRQGAAVGQPDIEAFRLLDIAKPSRTSCGSGRRSSPASSSISRRPSCHWPPVKRPATTRSCGLSPQGHPPRKAMKRPRSSANNVAFHALRVMPVR